MKFLYTARGTYDRTYDEDGMSWDKYIEWSKLTHLTELVSLDGMLIDLNDKGLVDDFAKAYDIKKRLLENHPDEHHTDTNVIAVWRHKTIGQLC